MCGTLVATSMSHGRGPRGRSATGRACWSTDHPVVLASLIRTPQDISGKVGLFVGATPPPTIQFSERRLVRLGGRPPSGASRRGVSTMYRERALRGMGCYFNTPQSKREPASPVLRVVASGPFGA